MSTDPEFKLNRLEAENQRLRRAVEELSIINEVALAVSSTSSLDQVVDLIVQKCVKHLHVEQGAVLMIESQDESAAMRTMVRKVQSEFAGIPFRLGDQITGWMLKNQQLLLVNDLAADGRFRLPPGAGEKMKSLMCVPLRLKGRMIGVLSVFNKAGEEQFGEGDQRLLTIIAAQSAQVIENARLYEEEQQLARIEQELATARDIQRKLLPKAPPDIPGYQIAGRSEAARLVGGDYFDYLETGAGSVGLCLADVSGKGISAALLMAYVQAAMRSQNSTDSTVSERVAQANRLLYESTDSDKFVTAFYGLLDLENHRLQYSNAGHNPPVVISREGELRRLETGGPVLGVLPSFPYEQALIKLHPGDVLLIYSDGFSEAMNLGFEEFGEERLENLAVECRGEGVEQILDQISEQVQSFCGEAPQTDDMTIMVVKRDS